MNFFYIQYVLSGTRIEMECKTWKVQKVTSRSRPLRVKQFVPWWIRIFITAGLLHSLNSGRSNVPEAEMSIHCSVSALLSRSRTSVHGEAPCFKPGNTGYAFSEVRDYKLHASTPPCRLLRGNENTEDCLKEQSSLFSCRSTIKT